MPSHFSLHSTPSSFKNNSEILSLMDPFTWVSILKKNNCPKCKNGDLIIKFAPTGPFLGCTNFNKDLDSCKYSASIGDDSENTDLTGDGKKIGKDPTTGREIFLKIGRYGRYLEMQNDDQKPKRISKKTDNNPSTLILIDSDIKKLNNIRNLFCF